MFSLTSRHNSHPPSWVLSEPGPTGGKLIVFRKVWKGLTKIKTLLIPSGAAHDKLL